MVNRQIILRIGGPVVVDADMGRGKRPHRFPAFARAKQSGERGGAGSRIIGREQRSGHPILDQFAVAAHA